MDNSTPQPIQETTDGQPNVQVSPPLKPKHTLRNLIIALILIFIITLVTIGTYFLNQNYKTSKQLVAKPTISPTEMPTPTSAPTEVIWQAKNSALSLSEINSIKTQILEKTKTVFPDDDITITSASISGSFGFISGIETLKKPAAVKPTTTYAFLLYKNAADWNLVTEQDSNFCDILKKLPDTLISQDSKSSFGGCYQ